MEAVNRITFRDAYGSLHLNPEAETSIAETEPVVEAASVSGAEAVRGFTVYDRLEVIRDNADYQAWISRAKAPRLS